MTALDWILQGFSFEREDSPVSAGRFRREHPSRKRFAYSSLPSYSLHSSATRCKDKKGRFHSKAAGKARGVSCSLELMMP